MKLKDFKKKKPLKVCEACSTERKELSSINVHTTDCEHRYKGSKRPFILNYSLKVCPKCYKRVMKQILDIII